MYKEPGVEEPLICRLWRRFPTRISVKLAFYGLYAPRALMNACDNNSLLNPGEEFTCPNEATYSPIDTPTDCHVLGNWAVGNGSSNGEGNFGLAGGDTATKLGDSSG